jgi:hypothetical protein
MSYSDRDADMPDEGHGWVRAQMLRLRARRAYCSKPTGPENWVGEDGDDWGRHVCWDAR